jgi:LysM repeat protein
MAVRPRLYVYLTLGAVPILFVSGCGDDATGARTTLETVQNTSYVVEDPVTTTTTTTLAPTPGAGQTSPDAQTYIVVAGDSVYKIAELHGVDPVVLANFNSWPEGVQHPLFLGDSVMIPPDSLVPAATGSGSTDTGGDEVSATQTTEASGSGCSHTIVAGDNPTRVANQYDVTVDELAAANAGNPVWNTFLIGSQLSIPANGSC